VLEIMGVTGTVSLMSQILLCVIPTAYKIHHVDIHSRWIT